ncbi:MAG: PQQ-binding-like beta-propeller repeat protein, partial [Bryobacterales bacterium]|nr:PQQ-binding-like beta-propeller repeat protein [Bryobacterales bacterium]
YAFEPETGELLWKYQTEDRVNSSPAVVDGKTFITGCDGKFRIIDIQTGEEDAWVDMQDYVAASPAVVGGSAYVGTFGYQVLKIDWHGKRIAWRYDHPDTDYEFFASPVVSGGLVVIGGRDKRVHAIDEATGELRWDFETRSRVDSSPVLAGDVIWVGSMDGHLYALGHQDGSLRWKFAIGGRIVASPAIADGRLVIGSRSGEGDCFKRSG